MLKNAIKCQHTTNMNIHAIAQSAATFNAQHDYDITAALKLTELVIHHAHMVQLARKEAADPQLALPLEVAE